MEASVPDLDFCHGRYEPMLADLFVRIDIYLCH